MIKSMANSTIKALIVAFVAISISVLFGCRSSSIEVGNSNNGVDVKYREESVNLASSSFEQLDTSKSSWIRGAWYDAKNAYLVIRLDQTYYPYCNVPESAWETFKQAESFGKEYNALLKGKFSCEGLQQPSY